ncbi:cytochrome b/b6 domain-containing protein [Rhodobium gokarnense]|uniref:Cytochrome b n=1 Tax=Rhodobium gokarnense TaxID=364296 RepID=A0ABT3HCA7_9HYPH|nr:cytochrome b/b6 domain-containing protein [Rhodobium gokarnense]MCW2308031.1 cytochrome b [Rhodobium gokarnense]
MTIAADPKRSPRAAASDATEEVRLWDPVVRILHWALLVAFAAAWILGEFGPADMTYHFWAGYTVAGIVVLRVIWGFIGPKPARFSSFVKGPGKVLAYAGTMFSRKPSNLAGHNPVGAIFVVAILALLALQVMTGLVSDPEDYINVGPLAQYVSSATSRFALSWHEPLAIIALVLTIIHVVSIYFYKFYKGEDLIIPMITGWKKVKKD